MLVTVVFTVCLSRHFLRKRSSLFYSCVAEFSNELAEENPDSLPYFSLPGLGFRASYISEHENFSSHLMSSLHCKELCSLPPVRCQSATFNLTTSLCTILHDASANAFPFDENDIETDINSIMYLPEYTGK